MHGVAGRLESSTKADYRPDIDGLRAIAVLSVLAFHYGAPLPGGFTGVDVFFVISGFLITRQLYADIERGTFSLVSFYDRRIRRIVPALLAVLITCLIAGYVLLTPGEYKALGGSAEAAAFGFSNFWFSGHTGYFDQAADMMPLLHTWSLGVEEQYYVVGPVILLAMTSVAGGRYVRPILMSLVISGFCISLAWLAVNPKTAFYMMPPRAWELALGALLVFLPEVRSSLSSVATGAGLSLLAIGFFVATPNHFPGAIALLPCIGAALVVWPKADSTRVSAILSTLKPIGLISYSLYLWHWPVWVFFRVYNNEDLPRLHEALALAAVSVLLAVLSYFLVEQPIRRRKWQATHVITVGLMSCLVVFGASMAIHRDGLSSRIPAEYSPLQSLETMWEWPCNTDNKVPGLAGAECFFGKEWGQAKIKAVLWGDSHAQHIAPIVEASAKDIDASFMLYTNCAAILGGDANVPNAAMPTYIEYCRGRKADGLRLLESDKSINLVILASSWASFPSRFTNGGSTGMAIMKAELEKFIQATQAPGRRYILISMIPQLTRKVLSCSVDFGLPRRACGEEITPPLRSTALSDYVDQMMRSIEAEFPNVKVLYPSDAFCNAKTCDLFMNGEFLYRDTSHIRRNLKPGTRRMIAERLGLADAIDMSASSTLPPQ